MERLRRVLLWIWQFPQNLAGFIMTLGCPKDRREALDCGATVYYTDNVAGAGVCLGDYILLDREFYFPRAMGSLARRAVAHESGHHAQSVMLGWLYLIVVGVPSAARNIYDRAAHKKWSSGRRSEWYYGSFPESWADRLGGVKR